VGRISPFFCAATETARDVAEQYVNQSDELPRHDMEDIMMDIAWSKIPAHVTEPEQVKFLTLLEVYVDDFSGMVQSTNKAYLTKVTRSLLHAIENVFPGPDISGSSMGPAISTKNIIDEGTWETRKEILGWLIDGIASTIELPPKKAEAILLELKDIRRSKEIAVSALRKIHGKLQFTSIALPCGKALLGPIDKILSMAYKAKRRRIKVNETLKNLLHDWSVLIRLMSSRPTHVKELVEHKPSYQGLVDASKWGVGGVWFGGTSDLEPFVWYIPWPQNIRDELFTSTNRDGKLTISDLGLMGIFMHFLALEAKMNRLGRKLDHTTVAIWCDNLPAVAWTYKFRTSTSAVASKSLRVLAVRLHVTRSALMSVDHISGVYNVMADVASREHIREHPDDPLAFLTYFTTHFPPPQDGY